jgi:RNA polymerase sigma-70 factor (ECF subfamily)
MGLVRCFYRELKRNAMGSEADEVLFERYRREGDMDAFATLMELHRTRLFGYLMGMVRDPVEADEVFQAVWIRVVRKADRFRGGNFRGWLFRIAHNLVVDRSRRRRPQSSLDACGESGQPLVDRLEDTAGAEAWLGPAAGDLAVAIDHAVGQLPVEQRDIFMLRTREGLAFKEIAALRGISINTALARMQYALGKLRRSLSQEYEEWRQR